MNIIFDSIKLLSKASILSTLIIFISYSVSISFGWLDNINYIELVAVFCAYSMVYLASQQSKMNFIFGIVMTNCYAILMYNNGYTGLMIFNLLINLVHIIGFIQWNKNNDTVIKTIYEKEAWLYSLLSVILFSIMLTIDNNIIGSLIPALSGTAIIMLLNKKIDAWILFIFGNIVSIIFFFSQELYFLVFQNLFFIFMNIYGYNTWKKNLVDFYNIKSI